MIGCMLLAQSRYLVHTHTGLMVGSAVKGFEQGSASIPIRKMNGVDLFLQLVQDLDLYML